MPHRAIGPGSLVASRFRLEDLLEESSGALFWRATDLTLARNVAIHVIVADDPRAAAVLTAARTSATVSDPHILRVLDAVEEGALVHVVHEWGSGVSLDRMLADDVLEPRRAAWLVREVAEAITVAHRHGIAHGRLLPENVLLTDAGAVKLIGFVVDAVLHGRPRVRGGPPPSEHESDVANLGGLLYACLTGRWPGYPPSLLPDAPTERGRCCRPRQVRPGVPRILDALCDQLLNPGGRDGHPRPESAAEVVALLNDFLGDKVAAPSVPVAASPAYADPHALRPPEPFDGVDTVATARGVLDGTDGTGAVGGTGGTGGTGDAEPTRPVRAPGTGMGGHGTVPPVWGPDLAPEPPAAGGPPGLAEPPGSSWLRMAAGVALLGLVLLAVVVAFQLGRTEEPPGGDDAPTATPAAEAPRVVRPALVRDFDPEQQDGGVPEENPELVPLATDGDPATAWETLSYQDGPVLAPYKSGVGLLLDLGAETDLRDVRVTLGGGPYDLSLLAAPEGTGTPTGTAELRTVATATGASGEVVLAGEEPVTTRYAVVWLTALPAGDGGFRGRVAEIVVRS